MFASINDEFIFLEDERVAIGEVRTSGLQGQAVRCLLIREGIKQL